MSAIDRTRVRFYLKGGAPVRRGDQLLTGSGETYAVVGLEKSADGITAAVERVS